MSSITPSEPSINYPCIHVASTEHLNVEDIGSTESESASINDNLSSDSEGREDSVSDEELSPQENDDNSSNFDGESGTQGYAAAARAPSRRSVESDPYVEFIGHVGAALVEQQPLVHQAQACSSSQRQHEVQEQQPLAAGPSRQRGGQPLEQRLTEEQIAKRYVQIDSYVSALSNVQVQERIAHIQNHIMMKNRSAQWLASNAPCLSDLSRFYSGIQDGTEATQNGISSPAETIAVNNTSSETSKSAERWKQILRGLISSQGTEWVQFIDLTVLDNHQNGCSPNHRASHENVRLLIPPQSCSLDVQSGCSHREAVSHQLSRGHERQNRRERNQGRAESNEINIQMVTYWSNGCEDNQNDADTVRPRARCGRCFSFKYKNILSWASIILIILVVTTLGAVGFIMFLPATTSSQHEIESTANFTKSKPLKSPPINVANAMTSHWFDDYSNSIGITMQDSSKRSHIKTTFFNGDFLHIEGTVERSMPKNESCTQVTLEIICCETFCEGKLKEGLIITRQFDENSQFCGAWRYKFNSAHICTRSRDRITITEFWSARNYHISDPSLNMADFQAIDYLAEHIAVILMKSISKSDQYCIVNFGRSSVKKKKCHDVGFLGLESHKESVKWHIVYLQHLTWAILSSQLVDGTLRWSIAVFKDKQSIMKTTGALSSEDNHLVVFGENPAVKVCALELVEFSGSREKTVSCIDYKFEA